jgi:hypothetical protein
MICLVYCHIGTSYPEYIFENIYQSLLFNDNCQIYVIINKIFINQFREKIQKMNISIHSKNQVILIPCELLQSKYLTTYMKYTDHWNENIKNFRDNFWVHTTSRFFYIEALIQQFDLQNVFHLENDVLIYTKLSHIYNKLTTLKMDDKIVAVQDSPHRAICSILFIPNDNSIKDFITHILNSIKSNPGQNDMGLMGNYKNKYHFPDSPNHNFASELGIYDGAAIGQYLGGTDLQNHPKHLIKNKYINQTIGFINETSTFKPNTVDFNKTYNNGLKKYITCPKNDTRNNVTFPINAIHLHSKQLYTFSSIFDLTYTDMITEYTVLSIVDFLITDLQSFEKNNTVSKFIKMESIICVYDFQKINVNNLQNIICGNSNSNDNGNNSEPIKIFVYKELLTDFIKYMLKLLPNTKKYIILTNGLIDDLNDMIPDTKIISIYSSFPVSYNNKVKLLACGLNGDLDKWYDTITSTYYKKWNSLYKNTDYDNVSTDELYIINHIKDLSSYRFALFNLDLINDNNTNKLWHALYLGVIPVFMYTHDISYYNPFLKQLEKNKIPYVTMKRDELQNDNLHDSLFTYAKYKQLLLENDISSIYNLPILKLNSVFLE